MRFKYSEQTISIREGGREGGIRKQPKTLTNKIPQ
jgi:hypothetical protein